MKLFRTFLLILAIAATAQAGEMDFGRSAASPIDQILVFLSLWF